MSQTIKIATPKFKVDDVVNFSKPDLYGCIFGKITGVEKVFAAVNDDGSWERGGLHIAEGTIKSMSCPYVFDGFTLMTDTSDMYPGGRKRVYKFKSYSYNIESAKMCSMWPERALKLRS